MADPAELIGYAASVLIVVSLTMSSVLRLRLVNLAGAVVFSAYAVLIGSLPVLLTNGAITLINIGHLARLWRERARQTYFEVVEVDPRSELLHRFIEFHAEDIARFQPGFAGVRDEHWAWMILRNGATVGVVLAAPYGDRQARIDLDYVTEAHRDFSAGAALFGESRTFESKGLTSVASAAGSSTHRRYLERMGFRADDGWWVREVG